MTDVLVAAARDKVVITIGRVSVRLSMAEARLLHYKLSALLATTNKDYDNYIEDCEVADEDTEDIDGSIIEAGECIER